MLDDHPRIATLIGSKENIFLPRRTQEKGALFVLERKHKKESTKTLKPSYTVKNVKCMCVMVTVSSVITQ